MLIKVIRFAIKFKIFDFHYQHFPFCNFQNSVFEKMWCCLTFVCVYIFFEREYYRLNEKWELISHLAKAELDWFHLYAQSLIYFICMRIVELRWLRSERLIQNEKSLLIVGFDPTTLRSWLGYATYCAMGDMLDNVENDLYIYVIYRYEFDIGQIK